jgi:lipid-binding SYLF domain-containing protein
MLSIQKNLQSAELVGVLFLAAAFASTALADERVVEARDTVAVFKKADPGIERFFKSALGYVVFSTVGKGALVVGGAGGKGILFEGGKAIGKASLAQVTVGLQLGGQAYSEIIFFENPAALDDFKHGNFAFAAQVSAVALAAGASTNAKYQSGVAVFTATKTGLMYEASVGGQKFGYEAFPVQGSK